MSDAQTQNNTANRLEPCANYSQCGCASGADGHCMYCLEPKESHTDAMRLERLKQERDDALTIAGGLQADNRNLRREVDTLTTELDDCRAFHTLTLKALNNANAERDALREAVRIDTERYNTIFLLWEAAEEQAAILRNAGKLAREALNKLAVPTARGLIYCPWCLKDSEYVPHGKVRHESDCPRQLALASLDAALSDPSKEELA